MAELSLPKPNAKQESESGWGEKLPKPEQQSNKAGNPGRPSCCYLKMIEGTQAQAENAAIGI